MVTTLFLRAENVGPTNSCMVGGSQGQVGMHKTADFTLTRTPRGHRTGCPQKGNGCKGGKGDRVSFKLQGNKGVRGVNDSFTPVNSVVHTNQCSSWKFYYTKGEGGGTGLTTELPNAHRI